MNLEPQKIFIGLMDFFSILLPGALLTYLLKGSLGPLFLGSADFSNITGTEAWVVFFFCSYLLGHFIFLLGATILDDYIYEPVRKATLGSQFELLAGGKKLSLNLVRKIALFLFGRDADMPLRQVLLIKEHYLNPAGATEAINAFQWCKARLTVENSEGLAMVQRFEADSKFFRSLLIVLVVFIPWGLAQGQWDITLISTLLMLLAAWRYADQRMKATRQAYWHIITLESQSVDGYRRSTQPRQDGMTHAGGVVYRQSGSQTEYLLVQAKQSPQEWVLPKGHIEAGEEMPVTAVREVFEEAGVLASVNADLGDITLLIDAEPIRVKFYLMEAQEEGAPTEGRGHKWFVFDEAVKQATHPESKDLLNLAEQIRVT